MAPETKRKPVANSSPDLAEAVAWLDCGGRSSAEIYQEVERLIQSTPADKNALFLILRHLERIEGSLTGFVRILEKILRTAPVRIVLGDPSCYVSLVLACLDRAPRFELLRRNPEADDTLPTLIVDPNRASAELLEQVLGAFGRPCEIASTGIDARRLIRSQGYGLVLLDLDLPHLQAFTLADLVREQRPATAIAGLTSSDADWALENMTRYGILKILPKPLSMLDFLALVP